MPSGANPGADTVFPPWLARKQRAALPTTLWARRDPSGRAVTGIPRGSAFRRSGLTMKVLLAAMLLVSAAGPILAQDRGTAINPGQADHYYISPGQSQTIAPWWLNAAYHGPCRIVANNDPARTMSVPTAYLNEWLNWIVPNSPPVDNHFTGNSPLATQTPCCPAINGACSQQWIVDPFANKPVGTPLYVVAPTVQFSLPTGLFGDNTQSITNYCRAKVNDYTTDQLISLYYTETLSYSCNQTQTPLSYNNQAVVDGAWTPTRTACCSNQVAEIYLSVQTNGTYVEIVDGCGTVVFFGTNPPYPYPPPPNPCP